MQECDLLHLCLQVLLTTGAGEAIAEGRVTVLQAAAALGVGWGSLVCSMKRSSGLDCSRLVWDCDGLPDTVGLVPMFRKMLSLDFIQ